MEKICINGHSFNLEKCDRCGGIEPISESISEPIQIKSRRKRRKIKVLKLKKKLRKK